MAYDWKDCVLLAAFYDKFPILHLIQSYNKRHVPWCAALAHSARSTMPLLASYCMVLPNVHEKPSRIAQKIEISTSTRWFLLGHFPMCSSNFRVSLHTSCCAQRSLISSRPVVHTLLLLRAPLPPKHAAWECAPAAAFPSTFWRHASQWVQGPEAGPPLLTFGAYWTEEIEPNRSKEFRFLPFLLGWSPYCTRSITRIFE